MQKLIRSGLVLAIVMTLAVGTMAWAQQDDADYRDGPPLIVTVVSQPADDVLIVRNHDGERIRVELAPDLPLRQSDLKKGDVLKLWTDEAGNTAHVEFAEIAVVKPHVTTSETDDPIANTTDPEPTGETDPVVVDPEMTSEEEATEATEAGEVDVTYEDRDRAEAENASDEIDTRERPMVVTVVSTTGREAVVRSEDGEQLRLRIAEDVDLVEGDLKEGDVLRLWTDGQEGDLHAVVEPQELGAVKPHVTTSETDDPIANTVDQEPAGETDPVVVDPALTAEEDETEEAEAETRDYTPQRGEQEQSRYTEQDELPRTASTQPLIALLGAVALVGGAALHFVGRAF